MTELTQPSGAVCEWATYDVYGLPTIRNQVGTTVSQSAVGNPWLYTGREHDPESGLYFYRARNYDPGVGRFLQRDPLGQFVSLGAYEYVNSSPAVASDPMGLEPTMPWSPEKTQLKQAIADYVEACKGLVDLGYESLDDAREAYQEMNSAIKELEKRIAELEDKLDELRCSADGMRRKFTDREQKEWDKLQEERKQKEDELESLTNKRDRLRAALAKVIEAASALGPLLRHADRGFDRDGLNTWHDGEDIQGMWELAGDLVVRMGDDYYVLDSVPGGFCGKEYAQYPEAYGKMSEYKDQYGGRWCGNTVRAAPDNMLGGLDGRAPPQVMAYYSWRRVKHTPGALKGRPQRGQLAVAGECVSYVRGRWIRN